MTELETIREQRDKLLAATKNFLDWASDFEWRTRKEAMAVLNYLSPLSVAYEGLKAAIEKAQIAGESERLDRMKKVRFRRSEMSPGASIVKEWFAHNANIKNTAALLVAIVDLGARFDRYIDSLTPPTRITEEV